MNKDNTYTLNLPPFEAKISKTDTGMVIFDRLRRRYVALTPEEWVRQHFVNYLISEKNYPASLMANEAKIVLNALTRRCDTIVYDNNLIPKMLLEYKSPDVKISRQVFDQIVRYNIVLRVKYLVVSNGLTHYACEMDYETQSFRYLDEIPDYGALTGKNQ